MRQSGQGAQLPRAARIAGLTIATLAVAAPAAADRTVAKTAQLDEDPAIERVERRLVDCPDGLNAPEGPEMCGYVAIVDGERDVRLTPTTQRPRFDYGWRPDPVRLRDLTGDGRPELVWDLSTSGGTGSSPRRFGAHLWTGERAVRIFMREQRQRAGRIRYVLPFRLDVLPPRRGLRELRVHEALYRMRDSTCCPSFRRTTRHRWDGERMRLVRGSTIVRRA